MKNVVGRISTLTVCLLVLFQVSCDDNDKLEAFLDNEKPIAATGLKANNLSTESLTLEWTPATDNVGVTSYEVFKDEVSIGVNDGETTFAVTNLSPSTTYDFYVVAFDAMENASDPSETITVTTPEQADTQKPTAPSNLTSSNLTQTTVTLNWEVSTDNVEVIDYEVFQGETSIGKTNNETTMDISGLTASTEYRYYVVALDAAGNTSDPSNTITITTSTAADTEAPTAPTSLSASEVTTTSLVLTWTASTDNETVESYEIFNGNTSIGTVSGTTFNVSNLNAATAYQFKVRAKDTAGNISEFSNVAEVTTDAAAPTQTIAEIIASNGDLSTLNTVLTGFDFNLDDEEGGPFTVFAPNNAAFAAFGTLPTGLALNNLIASHVAGGNYESSELVELGTVATPTGNLTITQSGEAIMINGNVQIIVKDIKATNGVIHIIDAIITN